MANETSALNCGDNECKWVMTGNGSTACVEGAVSCLVAKLIPATPSNFHDQTLVALTQQINALLQAVPPDPAGRKLSFMVTRMGVLLGWVEHGHKGGIPAGATTAESDNATIIQALGLML